MNLPMCQYSHEHVVRYKIKKNKIWGFLNEELQKYNHTTLKQQTRHAKSKPIFIGHPYGTSYKKLQTTVHFAG